MSILVELQTTAMQPFVTPATQTAPMDGRADEIHTQADDGDTLASRGARLIQDGITAARTQAQRALATVKAGAAATADSITRILDGNPNRADLTRAGSILTAVSSAVDTVRNTLNSKPNANIPMLLADALTAPITALLPGVSARDAKRALTVAARLLNFVRDPGNRSAAAFLTALGSGLPRGGLADFLLSSVTSMMMGRTFDLARFLPGALRAAGKDLKARAILMREDRR